MNKYNLRILIAVAINYILIYWGSLLATYLISLCQAWHIHSIIKVLLGVFILLILIISFFFITIFETTLINNPKQSKIFTILNVYPLYFVIAFCMFEANNNIGLLVMSIAAIISISETINRVNINLSRENLEQKFKANYKPTEEVKNKINEVSESEEQKITNTKTNEIKNLRDFETRVYIISCYEKYVRNENEEAIRLADKILEMDPNNIIGLSLRGFCLSDSKFYLDAIDDYKKIIDLQEDNYNMYGLLGLCYQYVGEMEKCREYLGIAVQKGYTNYRTYYEMMITKWDIFERIKEKGKNPANLIRREKSLHNTVYNLNETIETRKLKDTLMELLKKQPDNEEYKLVLNSLNQQQDFELLISRIFSK